MLMLNGVSQSWGTLCGFLYKKDKTTLGSILGYPNLGRLLHTSPQPLVLNLAPIYEVSHGAIVLGCEGGGA